MDDIQTAKSLLRRFVMFLIPLGILVLLGEWQLWRYGETWPAKRVAMLQRQSPTNILYGRELLSQQFWIYKLAGMELANADILAVGNSRVMQFRNIMFTPLQDRFYNAGGMIANVHDFSELANGIAKGSIHKPKCMIVGVELWWFKQPANAHVKLVRDTTDDAYRASAHIEAMRLLVRRGHLLTLGFRDAARPDSLPYPQALGLLSITLRSGFRRDGSWRYPERVFRDFKQNPTFVDRESPPTITRIENRTGQFSAPLTFDQQLMRTFVDAVKVLTSSGVEVIVFHPPYSNQCNQALDRDPELRLLRLGIDDRIFPEVKSVGAVTFQVDASRSSDLYMYDGLHPSEVYIAKILAEMIEDCGPRSILRQIDQQHLAHFIQSSDSSLAHATVENFGYSPTH